MDQLRHSLSRSMPALAALFMLGSACTTGGSSSSVTATSSGRAATQSPSTLVVAQFNTDISDEWPRIDVEKVAEAIRASGADVVGVEEGGAAIPKLALYLGWSYYDVRMQIVSRLPLIDPPDGNGIYTFVQLRPGAVVAMENVHLASDPYGPYWIRDGKPVDQVVALEKRVRLPGVADRIAAAGPLVQQGIPVFLTGDFNSPSSSDWTAAAIKPWKFRKYPVSWPVTAAVEAAGFKDSYRTVHPDPVTDPGVTWPVKRPIAGWNPTPRDPADRIDFIFAAGAATPTSSTVVGEPGGPAESASVSPWQSDHRLVVSTFNVTPGTPPSLVTVPQRLVSVGDDVPVTYHADGGSARQVSIVPAGGAASSAVAKHDVAPGVADGTFDFATANLQPGAYEALLLDSAGTAISHFPFWLEALGTVPTITTSQESYKVGEPIGVSWTNAPGERWDWVAVYKRGADPLVAYYIDWVYTKSTVDGSATLDASANGPWPLKPGKYSVYLLKDDLYVKIASADFTVGP